MLKKEIWWFSKQKYNKNKKNSLCQNFFVDNYICDHYPNSERKLLNKQILSKKTAFSRFSLSNSHENHEKSIFLKKMKNPVLKKNDLSQCNTSSLECTHKWSSHIAEWNSFSN